MLQVYALFAKICYGEIMKKLSLYIFLVLLCCNIGFANDFNYTCSLDVQFKTSDNSKWYNKEIIFNISNSGNILKMYDKEINLYRPDQTIFVNNSNEVIASKTSKDKFNSFVFNKNTLNAKYSNMYFDDEGGGEYGVGQCN